MLKNTLLFNLFCLNIFFSQLNGELILPANNSIINYVHVLFEWDQIPDTYDYRIQVSTASDFSEVVTDTTVSFLIYIDDNNIHEPDIFAAMLYLNDNFTGGSTMFEDIEIKPKPGKLIIFSNNKHLHYVSEVGGAERFVLSFWYSRPNANV